MADSPLKNSDGVATFTIKIAGAPINSEYQVVSIEVNKQINRIPTATFELLDGSPATGEFPISDENDFKPGNEVIISAGYDSTESQIFRGIIIRHGISISGESGAKLIIECKDKAIGMTIARHSNNYVKQKDSEIITTLINNCSGVTADVATTTTTFEELVQFNCTDWDFILARAEANGLVICIDDNTLTIKEPQTSSSAVLTLTYGNDLIEFTADIDARYQFKSVKGISWDISTQTAVFEQVAAKTMNAQGDLKSVELADTLALADYRMQTGTALEKTALKDWATGQQVKSALARIRGQMKFQGNASAKVGCIIEVVGVGNRFSGDLYISGVKQTIGEGQWFTETTFGLSPSWSAEHRDLAAPPAAGLMPGVEGLQIGVVMKLDGDPNEQNRIQVSVPVMQAQTEGVWARLATYYASSDFGHFFIPEIGDEVVLGYFNNDPCEPVILGSMYSSKNNPAYALSAENNLKAIVTKSKLKIEFNEEDKVITVITPSNNKIILSDKDKSILLQDQNDNKVELGTGGITLDSPKDITISAKGKISIDAVGAVSISSKADVKGEGLNVNLTAKVGFVAKGSATAELSASGQTTVKGAMVMIN
ncbi:MAG: Rhs element Vgr protein [Paraglaciecola sp.]|jgi:Rhs element Vgr protein